jgi:hypothetical protein
MATPSTDSPISPLRQRMQHDMLMRGMGSHTQQDYVRHVRRFGSEASRCAHRHHRRTPHLGFGDDPPSARAHDRAGRRHGAGRKPMDIVASGLPPPGARAGFRATVPSSPTAAELKIPIDIDCSPRVPA